MRIVVLGCGSWGTALSILLTRNGAEVQLLGRDPDEVYSIQRLRENLKYLPGFILPEEVSVANLEDCRDSADFVISAVPAVALRSVLHIESVKSVLRKAPLVLASKGLEVVSGQLLGEMISEVLPDCEVGAISGPNLALEIVRGIPTAAVVGFRNIETAEKIRPAFMSPSFRVYQSQDVVGLELAGALKNVLAIAAGISDGLGFGDNTKGALLARGLREMIALGRAMNASPETFLGIAGVGDLFATAVSSLSRNYRVGRSVGSGKNLSDALEEIGQVAEGVPTSAAVIQILKRFSVVAPILESVHLILEGHLDSRRAVQTLMERTTPFESISL